jgi:hypothetical protein
MKKYTTILLLVIFAVCVCFESHFSQSRNITEKDIELQILNKLLKANVDDSIEIKVRLKNNFRENIGLPYDRYDSLGGYKIEITDAKGEIVKINKKQDENIGVSSRVILELRPKESYTSFLNLSNYYNLPVGKYLVTVHCLVKTLSNKSITVSSKPTVLKVVK